MNNLPALQDSGPRDPSTLGWPPTLPIEIAMQATPLQEICESYGLSQAEWLIIKACPGFIVEVSAAIEAFKKEGIGFRTRCRVQATELLKESWRMIHDADDKIPPSVKADLIKFTIKAAGYDGSRDQIAAAGNSQNNFAIQIDLRRD